MTRSVAVPVSAGLLADVEGYHQALTSCRGGAADPMELTFAHAALRAVENAGHLLADIEEVRGSWNDRLGARRDSNARRLPDVLVRRPVLDSATATAELGIKQPNVHPPMCALAAAGVVRSKEEHLAGPFWRSDEILATIDAFARRAGRRGRS